MCVYAVLFAKGALPSPYWFALISCTEGARPLPTGLERFFGHVRSLTVSLFQYSNILQVICVFSLPALSDAVSNTYLS